MSQHTLTELEPRDSADLVLGLQLLRLTAWSAQRRSNLFQSTLTAITSRSDGLHLLVSAPTRQLKGTKSACPTLDHPEETLAELFSLDAIKTRESSSALV